LKSQDSAYTHYTCYEIGALEDKQESEQSLSPSDNSDTWTLEVRLRSDPVWMVGYDAKEIRWRPSQGTRPCSDNDL